MNRVFLLGRLGADPEIRYTPNGEPVTTFNVATTKRWTDKSGNRQEKTEWHRVVVFGKLAEICAEHLEKGKQVFVEGALQTRSYEDRDGVKRYVTEIVAFNVEFLGNKANTEEGISEAPEDDDIPF